MRRRTEARRPPPALPTGTAWHWSERSTGAGWPTNARQAPTQRLAGSGGLSRKRRPRPRSGAVPCAARQGAALRVGGGGRTLATSMTRRGSMSGGISGVGSLAAHSAVGERRSSVGHPKAWDTLPTEVQLDERAYRRRHLRRRTCKVERLSGVEADDVRVHLPRPIAGVLSYAASRASRRMKYVCRHASCCTPSSAKCYARRFAIRPGACDARAR